MASFSSSRNWRYHVFPSFSGEDVRGTLLSHLLKELQLKGIETFIDHGIKRGQSIGPELIQAIRESRISIVILSKNYASSSWCLNELLEIMTCKEAAGQTVMTIFYELDPSDVRKQTGDFGRAFDNACARKTEQEKQRWRKALIDVSNIAGVHSQKWDNEADMIEKIAKDVSDELNYAPSRDFDGLVGIETNMTKMNSLLCLESEEVRIVGIWGPPGIGKTTIARVLYNRLSSNFQHSCFMENIGGNFTKAGLDAYGLQLHLQERFLSEILKEKDLRVQNLGVAQQRLRDRKVLVVLDGVDKLEQLEALVGEKWWFGPKSRVIVITEDKKLLSAHNINHIYEMDFPSNDEALQIFCQNAFRQNSPPDDFQDLSLEVANLAGNLPLGLSVLGSYVRGMSKDEWELALPRLRTSLEGGIEKVLRVSYDALDEKDQAIFRHIACLFNGDYVGRVTRLLADSDLDVRYALQALARKSLIQILTNRSIVMHNLLQQVGREVVRRQSINRPGKREFLVDSKDICDVLTDNTGTESVLGISLTILKTGEWFISDRAFETMPNLRFLRFYKQDLHYPWNYDIPDSSSLHLPPGFNFLPRKLRLLHWDAYPNKSMPPRFYPEFLVELIMQYSQLEKLWKGIQPLRSLKRMDLSWSEHLKEIPDLSKATNLEKLRLVFCKRLVKLPSSIRHLNKLKILDMSGCKKLKVLPTNINLESLGRLDLYGCSGLKSFPEISRNIEYLNLSNTSVEEVPSSIMLCCRLTTLSMFDCKSLKTFPCVPDSIEDLYLSETRIEEVPWWIGNLTMLRLLFMYRCEKLTNISPSISKLERLVSLTFSGCTNLASFPAEIFQSCSRALIIKENHLKRLPIFLPEKASTFIEIIDLSYSDFERIPNCFKFLSRLRQLDLRFCRKLVSLPELPNSLSELFTDGCESLERISHSFDNPEMILTFTNCFKLNQKARELIRQSVCKYACLPGRTLPACVTRRASGGSLIIHLDKRPDSGFLEFKPCLVIAARPRPSHMLRDDYWVKIECHIRGKRGDSTLLHEWKECISQFSYHACSDHLIMLSPFYWPDTEDNREAELTHNGILLEFNCIAPPYGEIRECGVQVLVDEDGGYETAFSNLSSDSDEEMMRSG